MRVQFCFQFIFPPFSFPGCSLAHQEIPTAVDRLFPLSFSFSMSRSYPRFSVAFACVAFSTNLLRHLQPPSTKVCLPLDPSLSLSLSLSLFLFFFLSRSLSRPFALSLVLFLSFRQPPSLLSSILVLLPSAQPPSLPSVPFVLLSTTYPPPCTPSRSGRVTARVLSFFIVSLVSTVPARPRFFLPRPAPSRPSLTAHPPPLGRCNY